MEEEEWPNGQTKVKSAGRRARQKVQGDKVWPPPRFERMFAERLIRWVESTKYRNDEKKDPTLSRTKNERVGHPGKKRQIQSRFGESRMSHPPGIDPECRRLPDSQLGP